MPVSLLAPVYSSQREYQNKPTTGVRIAERPDKQTHTRIKVDTKLSVYEAKAGNTSTIAGVPCSTLVKLQGQQSFWVKASMSERSYTVRFNQTQNNSDADVIACNPRLTIGDSFWLLIKTSLGMHQGETGNQLIAYMNHNLRRYKAHQADQSGEKTFKQFVAEPVNCRYIKT